MLQNNASRARHVEVGPELVAEVRDSCRASADGLFARQVFFAVSATLALVGALFLSACATSTSPESASNSDATSRGATSDNPDAYQKISAEEGQALMENSDVTIVDVRTTQEYAEGHIPGAINIPVESIGDTKPSELSDTDANLIVYCRTGVRSKQASDKLLALGYIHVNDMGGIVDWHGDTVTGDKPDGK